MTPEINSIKANIEACVTIPDVNHCFNHHRPRMVELWREGGDMKVMALQIDNLKKYQIKMIKAGWIR